MSRSVRFYIAGRTREIRQIKSLATELVNLGYINTFDWTTKPSYKPYSQNHRSASSFAKKTLRHIKEADYLILVWDDLLYGALIEFGYFLAQESLGKHIYILGPKNRVCVFETLPQITACKNKEELIAKILKDFPAVRL